MNLHTHRNHDSSEAQDRMKGGLRDLVAGVEDLLRSTASYSGADIESTRDRLKRQLDAAREQATAWERSAVGRYRHVSAATDGYVHDHAWKTAGLAIVLGIAIGACLASDHWRR
ncbi:YqjD family protein [Bordetella sp. BOR01]|uniref:DUF883 family protein n=1 Tax=Bordetella sp. BOR01 TaxID=2854779 RepID=UPI001C476CD4|nr:DUF883 family protein [Bordetella sp. BOR01]MBV7486119.1 DUF883 family protein [Bordetella sp. BOR01]